MAATRRPPSANPEPAAYCIPAALGGGRWDHLVVHCKRAPFDVYIGRKCRGAPAGETGEWGNPFAMKDKADRLSGKARRIQQYAEWLHSQPELCERARRELRGKVLGCWCAPERCHGHVLAEVANSPAWNGQKPVAPPPAGVISAPCKPMKKLGKKLAEIERLKEQRAADKVLMPNQLAKLSTETEVRKQLSELSLAKLEPELEPLLVVIIAALWVTEFASVSCAVSTPPLLVSIF